MTSLPHNEHAIRRKAFAPHYVPSNLALFQPEIQNFATKLTEVSTVLVVLYEHSYRSP